MMRAPERVARKLVAAINAHDPSALGALVSKDHLLVDSLGRSLRGRPAVLEAWSRYFARFPDYTIDVGHALASGETVALFGWASGTLAGSASPDDGRWRIPAAWRASVRGERVAEWQVYADNKPVYELLARGAG